MRTVLAFAWAMALLLASAAHSHALTIEGKVFHEGGFANGARVHAYKSFSDMKEGISVAVSEPSKEKGDFSMDVPEGNLVFVAKWRHDDKEFFCYQPSNPMEVKPGTWVTLFCNESLPASIAEAPAPGGWLTGRVTFHGEPLEKAYVSLYFDSASELRGLGYLTFSTDKDGRFGAPVNEGDYMVVARKRQSGRGLGPTAKGDIFCYFPGNPVQMREGREISVEVPCMPIQEIKMFLKDWDKFTDEVKFKPENYEKKYDRALKAREKRFVCGIKGRVTGEDGKPVPGLLVLVHTATSEQVFYMSMLHLRTAAGVATTDENGEYFVELEKPGLYYLTVREELATSPPRGEYFGQYEDDVFHRVEVKEGEVLEGKDITVVRVLELPGEAKKSGRSE